MRRGLRGEARRGKGMDERREGKGGKGREGKGRERRTVCLFNVG